MLWGYWTCSLPPGWLHIKDVPIQQHKWLYCPLGHIHTHFPEHTAVRLIVRKKQGENSTKAPQPVEMAMCVPIDPPLHLVIQRALADLPSGRLGSFCKQVVCTLALPKSANAFSGTAPPIPHDTTLREMYSDQLAILSDQRRAKDMGQFPRMTGNMRTRCPSQSHYGCQDGLLGTWAVSTQMSTLHPDLTSVEGPRMPGTRLSRARAKARPSPRAPAPTPQALEPVTDWRFRLTTAGQNTTTSHTHPCCRGTGLHSRPR